MRRPAVLLLVLLGTALPTAPALARDPGWPAPAAAFWTAFSADRSIEERREAVLALAASKDARAIEELLRAVDLQEPHVEHLRQAWWRAYEVWDRTTRRLSGSVAAKMENAVGGSLSVSPEEDEWLGLTAEYRDKGRKVSEGHRIAGLQREAAAEEDCLALLYASMGRVAHSLAPEPEEAARAVERLLDLAARAPSARRPFFVETLGPLTADAATDALERFGRSDDLEIAVRAVEALGQHDPERTDGILTEHLRDPRREVRAAAARALARRGDADRVELPAEAPSGATSFYGIPSGGRHVVFVVEASKSMAEGAGSEEGDLKRIDVLRRELKAALASLSEGGSDAPASFNIVVFKASALVYAPGAMIRATPEATDEAGVWIDTYVRAFDDYVIGTNLYDALGHAFDLEGADTIFLVCDGHSTYGPIVDRELLLRAVGRRNRISKIPLHTVAVGHGTDAELLRRLAARNQGRSCAR